MSEKLNYNQLLSLNKHLINKNKQLAQELEHRNTYIADLSHRLRTPLSAIFGMTALAKGSIKDTHLLSDCLDKIDFSTHMLINTVNEIQELDAVRKGNLIIHNACFDFKLLLSSISSMCNSECCNKDIFYDVALQGVTEETLIGDSVRLNRVLMIILSRAVNATDAGGHVKLRIAQRNINKNFVQIQFCIIDTGKSLTADEIKEFTKESGDSSIVLAKKICNLMNGTITFESKRGVGTVISMTIPFGINPVHEIATQEFFDTYRVLLISHDEQTITNVTEVLKRIGTECVFVSDSDKAIVMLLDAATMNKDFNLCLVDWSASIPDGIEQTKAIRNAGNDALKLVAITVSESTDLQLAVRMSGADQLLPKPLFQSTVFNLMMELTGREYTQLTVNPDDFDFSGCKILLAEDNDLSAQITISQLDAVGIYTDRVESGADCLDILSNAKAYFYDLILLDIKMPYLDGCQTATAIRSLDLYGSQTIPIVALTADALADDITAAFEAGMDDYVIKPIDNFQLYSTLAKYITKK